MSSPRSDPPFIGSVLHPTDFSETGERAFAHALTVALLRQAELTLLHAGGRFAGRAEWKKFPPIRKTLERWGLLEKGSPRSAVFEKLSVSAEKVAIRGPYLLGAILGYLDDHRPDLLVLATEGREGLPRWLRPSKAERLARGSGVPTLFVPKEGRGFVSVKDGELSLRRILIPADRDPNPRAAVVYASRAAEALGEGPVEIELLYVGEGEMPSVETPESPSCRWKRTQRSGKVVEEILSATEEPPADLVAMTTRGHDGFLDVLRGSVTEQVLRGARCPLLAVPAD